MDSKIIHLDLAKLHSFFDALPDPIIANVVITPVFGRGMALSLKYPGAIVTLVEDGRPCLFSSLESIIGELDAVPNVDTTSLVVDTTSWMLKTSVVDALRALATGKQARSETARRLN